FISQSCLTSTLALGISGQQSFTAFPISTKKDLLTSVPGVFLLSTGGGIGIYFTPWSDGGALFNAVLLLAGFWNEKCPRTPFLPEVKGIVVRNFFNCFVSCLLIRFPRKNWSTFPLSYLKFEIRSAALNIWQYKWDNGETRRSTYEIVPTVPNKPLGWRREELLFVSGHGPFPPYLLRLNLRTNDNCSCGEKGNPMHYATK
ncbi:hypothetical protein AVEN_262645-1, partial [Araneus ventricosus]